MSQGKGDFGVGESAFGADGGDDVGPRLALGSGERLAARMRDHVNFGVRSTCKHVARSTRLGDFDQAVAAALLAGCDHAPAEAIECGSDRLSNAAVGDERDEASDAELRYFFDKPFLAVAFG